MKRLTLAIALLAAGTSVAAEKSAFKPSNEDAKVAYSIGFLNGSTSLEQLKDLDVNAYVAGFRDAYSKVEPALSKEDINTTLNAFKERLTKSAEADMLKFAEENAAKGKAYLAANAKKKGVKTTQSGLQYEVLKEGKGSKPKASDTVTVHYEGRSIDGAIFDSSLTNNEPVSFQLDQVIDGWTEGLQLMTPGSKYKLTIPADLAYGADGVGPIAPNSVLVFEVELIRVGDK